MNIFIRICFIIFPFLLLDNTYSIKPVSVVVEAENFKDIGGWVIDQQSIDQIGSSYLLAHGLGKTCTNAKTTVTFPEKGIYHIWVRTRNWVSPSLGKLSPGRFNLLVNGEPLDTIFGQDKTIWNWHYGGKVRIINPTVEIGLQDLTGFEGRCDAIVFSTDSILIHHQEEQSLMELRRKIQGCPRNPISLGTFDFVVVGGGVAGITASLTAARLGLKVALIHDRPVLGGNNSSEIRVHMVSDLNIAPFKKLGDVTKELDSLNTENVPFNDEAKFALIHNEPNIELFPEMHVTRAIKKNGTICKVIAQHIRNNQEYQLSGALFADCTGDGNLGVLSGANYRYGRESIQETKESLAPDQADSLVLGATLHWKTELKSNTISFPNCTWALPFAEGSCQHSLESAWNWETGFQYDMVNKVEFIRDNMLRAIYGNWAFQKNESKNKEKYQKYELSWIGYILGKRESRRLLGDIIYSQQDIDNGIYYTDGCVSTRWGIDLHYADPVNTNYFPGNEFRSIAKHAQKATHPICSLPYRCLYSRNISNLFMAGRCVSMTHVAHGMFRTQYTTGMMGEVVGMAAWLCKKNKSTPREIYTTHWNEMKTILSKGL